MSPTAHSAADRIPTLATRPVIAAIPPDELGLLAEMMHTERLAAGETLLEQGEPSDRIYVVARGSLCVSLPAAPEPLRTRGPGALLGAYGLFVAQGRTATVRAGAESTLLSLDYPRFRAFLRQFPEATLVLLATAVERLVAAEAAAHEPPPASSS